ncbi:MAG: Fe-Mn family superoxide dismutase [Simkaniaceae bacterium]|nr:Fe-Mn family superoxide dismutase [Simkaniaceae bacterium]
MEGFSDSLLEMHLKLYQGYVKNTNSLQDTLNKMVKDNTDDTIAYGALQRRFSWEYDGMVLHELYFENLGGNGHCERDLPIYQMIEEEFGSFSTFLATMRATGLIKGVGWAILYLGPKDHRLHVVWIDEHDTGHLAGGTPLLVMDVWEHAYITEYGLNRSAYIESFLKNVDWHTVNSRLNYSK